MIIDRLTSQHYDARIVQRRWVDDSFAFGDRLAIYLENQAKEWNNLIEYWNRTTTKHDEHQHNKNHKQKLDLLVLDHEWKMINQSMNQLYKRQYREIVDLQIARCTPAEYILVGIDWNNTSIFDQFCSYLNSIQSANLYDTQFIILQNLKVTHKDVYLKVYNSFTTLKSRHPQNRQLASFRTVSKIDIEEWKFELTLLLDKIWKDGPNQTLPLWFLKTSSYWEIIKLVYMYILDYIYEFFLVRLENYAAIQKKNLLLNLNLALEHLRNL